MNNFIKTSEIVSVENYPYSFSLKTTLFDSMEFNPKKGFRHVTQTINPKTGVKNKPKKDVYYALLVRYRNENGHIKTLSFDFNGDKEINRGCKFVAENFEIFTADEINYIYDIVYYMAFVDMKATAMYGGSNIEELKPLYMHLFTGCKEGKKEGSNMFGSLLLDTEAIEATKPKDFNPFRIKVYEPQ